MAAKYLKFSGILLLIFTSFSVKANESKNLGFATSLTFLSGLYEKDDYRYAVNSLYAVGATYSLNKDHSLSLGLQGTKNLSGDFKANDETITLSHGQKLGSLGIFSTTSSQFLSIPINKRSRRDASLNGSIAASVTLTNAFHLGVPAGFSVSLLGKKNSHDF